MSADLVFLGTDGEPLTTSLVVAQETGSEHRAVLQLIRNYLDDLNEVGGVAFEMQPFETAGGTQRREVALLDEMASALLTTFLKNTSVVRDFKKRLVRGFYAMRQLLAERAAEVKPLTGLEYARRLVDAEERVETEAKARAEAESRAKELEAPASAWKHLAASEGDYEVADAAKVLSRDPNINIGRGRLFSFMAAEGWVFRNRATSRWKAYQTQVDNGRLTERFGRPFLHEPTGEMRLGDPTIRITPKGMEELHKRLGGSGQLALVAAS
jgi:phage regulator Rha-like protein